MTSIIDYYSVDNCRKSLSKFLYKQGTVSINLCYDIQNLKKRFGLTEEMIIKLREDGILQSAHIIRCPKCLKQIRPQFITEKEANNLKNSNEPMACPFTEVEEHEEDKEEHTAPICEFVQKRYCLSPEFKAGQWLKDMIDASLISSGWKSANHANLLHPCFKEFLTKSNVDFKLFQKKLESKEEPFLNLARYYVDGLITIEKILPLHLMSEDQGLFLVLLLSLYGVDEYAREYARSFKIPLVKWNNLGDYDKEIDWLTKQLYDEKMLLKELRSVGEFSYFSDSESFIQSIKRNRQLIVETPLLARNEKSMQEKYNRAVGYRLEDNVYKMLWTIFRRVIQMGYKKSGDPVPDGFISLCDKSDNFYVFYDCKATTNDGYVIDRKEKRAIKDYVSERSKTMRTLYSHGELDPNSFLFVARDYTDESIKTHIDAAKVYCRVDIPLLKVEDLIYIYNRYFEFCEGYPKGISEIMLGRMLFGFHGVITRDAIDRAFENSKTKDYF